MPERGRTRTKPRSRSAPSAPAATAEIRLADVTDWLEGLSAYQRFTRLNKVYVAQLREGAGDLRAEERRVLLDIAQRSLALLEPADLFLQTCQEQTSQAKGPELDKRLKEFIESQRLNDAVRGRLTEQDLLRLAEESTQSSRALLADERERLQEEIAQLQSGERPERTTASDDISADAEFGAGATFVIGGLAVAATLATAPVTVPAVVVGAGLFAAGAAVGAGAVMMVDAVTS
jgi:hypothetical protein